MKIEALFLTIVFFVFCFFACSEQNDVSKIEDVNLGQTIVTMNGNILFGDLSEFNIRNTTRAGQADIYSSTLSSLIDEKATVIIQSDGYKVYQTPFRSNEQLPFVDIRDGDNELIENSSSSHSIVKKFLLSFADDYTGSIVNEVVTMIATPEYLSAEGSMDFTWENRKGFCGLIIYSTVNGELVDVKIIDKGRIIDAVFLEPGQSFDTNTIVKYIMVPGSKTRSNYTIEASYCTAYLGDNSLSNNLLYNELVAFESASMRRKKEPSSMKVSTSGRNVNSTSVEKQVLEEFYTVRLASNSQNIKVSPTCERYLKGSTVSCIADVCSPFVFDRWTGDLSGIVPVATIYNINKDYSAMALLKSSTPCIDHNGKSNPLMGDLYLAPTESGNSYNALFDLNNPNRGKGCHHGIDFACDIGTPIFSIADGTVVSICDIYTYTNNDECSYGNRIVIRSTINGKEVDVMYAHLQFDNPIADNPFKSGKINVGDVVVKGELIAYSGRSGNAYNVPHPHLHLGIRTKDSDGKYGWIDPLPYLNGHVELSEYEKMSKRANRSLELQGIDCPETN